MNKNKINNGNLCYKAFEKYRVINKKVNSIIWLLREESGEFLGREEQTNKKVLNDYRKKKEKNYQTSTYRCEKQKNKNVTSEVKLLFWQCGWKYCETSWGIQIKKWNKYRVRKVSRYGIFYRLAWYHNVHTHNQHRDIKHVVGNKRLSYFIVWKHVLLMREGNGREK